MPKGKSGYSTWGTETDLYDARLKNRQGGRENTLVTFTPGGGWVLVTNGGGFGVHGPGIPEAVEGGRTPAYEGPYTQPTAPPAARPKACRATPRTPPPRVGKQGR